MRVIFLVVLIFTGLSCWAEGSCFRTVSQAAVQVGELEGGGYRLVFVRVDPFDGRAWAGVRSCLHPEWPPLLVAGTGSTVSLRLTTESKQSVALGHPDVVGGKTVKVVQLDPRVRIEMSGVAQASGRVGDRIWIRMLGPAEPGNGHLELGLVRGADLVEVGQ